MLLEEVCLLLLLLSDNVPAKCDIGKLMKMIFTCLNINKVGR